MFLAVYSRGSYESAKEAHKHGGLYISEDDFSYGASAVYDALTLAETVANCLGYKDTIKVVAITDEEQGSVITEDIYSDEWYEENQ